MPSRSKNDLHPTLVTAYELAEHIEGYDGYYITKDFKIISMRSGHPVELSQTIGTGGYYYVTFRYNGKNKIEKVHRLIAKAFIPNPENKPFVNHKNSNRLDNSIDNLEWCTQKENIVHGYKHGNMKPYWLGKSGYENKKSKEVTQYDIAGNKLKSYGSASVAAKENGYNFSLICRSCRNGTKAYGYKWKYEQHG